MGVGESPRHLAEDARRLVRGKGAPLAYPLTKRLALDVHHREEDEVVDVLHRVDGHDVRLRKLRRGAGLAHEPLPKRTLCGHLRRKQLERDRPVEAHLLGQVDDTHPAPAELALERVAARERRLEV